MGDTAHVKSISFQVLAILEISPALIEPFVCSYPPTIPPGFPEEMREAFLQSPAIIESLRSMREWLRDEAPEHADLLITEAARPHVYLEKAWRALQEFLDGLPAGSPANRCIFGGREVGPDLGYGCARLLQPDEVKACAAALVAVDTSSLPHQILRDLFFQLQRYYREASQSDHAILQHLA